jgi:hypothetical protein
MHMAAMDSPFPRSRFARPAVVAWLLAASLLAGAPRTLAAYFAVEVGTFRRSDGTLVTAFEKDNGRVMYSHTRCWFAMPDGSTVSVDEPGKVRPGQPNRPERRYRACAIRTGDTGAEIYRYASSRLPVAGSVQRFDGYAFVDVTTPGRRWFSPLLHISHHWTGYLLGLILVLTFLVLDAQIVSKTCGRGWWRTLRVISITAGVCFTSFYVLVTTMFGAHSPLIHALVAGAGISLYWAAWKLRRPYRPQCAATPSRRRG